MVTCCKDCQERELGCHSKCEIYISAVEKHRETKVWLKEANEFTRARMVKKRRKKRG